jgi:3-oxoadipate enol-lactonase/4-carboxymuconolactone decarboxylase
MTLAFAPPAHDTMAGFVRESAALYGLDAADVPGALAQVEHLLEGWDLRPRLARLATPTLVMAGLRDPIVAAEDTCELARAIPGAKLLEVPGAAHSVLAEGGREALDELMGFLAGAP